MDEFICYLTGRGRNNIFRLHHLPGLLPGAFFLILLRPIATGTKVMQRAMKMHRCVTDHLLDMC